ncbi:non-specific lipid-transfer protein 1-like [Lolium rigidum]|uniref:non-specific lipid-transfer protein 1-like n=1 Tax=Lolium rigidum TaxID=89674 RepID=UPI001F5D0B08|nr:non-specific lipid-transfer protein 1-like [Lolium rigidum]
MARAAATLQLLLVAVVAAMLLAAPHTADAAISCGHVNAALSPCILYARGLAGAPSAACCGGVKSLAAATKTTADRRAACSCLKMAASRMTGLNNGNTANIPAKCGVSVPYGDISASVDCSKVN